MIKRENMPIYMDYQATTPVDPRVVDKMMPYFSEIFGNAASRTHAYGWESEKAVETARKHIAELISADAKDIIFTSGATESNNLALKGAMDFYKDKGDHLITVATEHKCVIDTARYLKQQGKQLTVLPVDDAGRVNLEDLKNAITDKTVILSVMGVNNETGTMQDLKAIGKICKEHGVLFHTDAAQAFGKVELDVEDMGIDLMSISAHKIYGPKGIGALYVRRRKPRVRLTPLIHGGGQERGMRSGTLSTSLIVGFGEASRIAKEEMEPEANRLIELKKYMYNKLNEQLEEVYLNGSLEDGIPGNLNLSFAFIEGESLMMAIKGLAVSSGSACTSASLESSYVLKAMGKGDDLAHTSIRFGIGRFTTKEEIEIAVETVVREVNRLRDLSPLWEMFKEGIDLSKIQWNDEHGGH
ncbi:MAG TPA: IscS subfamily cysteine desulfurase [Alphaproteobacteria bacterium]|nr:IscS subfamily cysteine desulfurase [Alphaproteobacteria bacterium]